MMPPNPPRVFLEAGNPYDFGGEELDELAETISQEHPEVRVSVHVRDELGYGVSFDEVLRVYMDVGEFAGNTAAIFGPFLVAVAWARKRWHRDRSDRPEERPRSRVVFLLGPNGEPIRTVRIDEPDGEPVDDSRKLTDLEPWPPDRKTPMSGDPGTPAPG